MNTSGILSIAVKNPYYGRMAYNLCASIKAYNRDIEFALIADQSGLSHLSSRQIELFDYIIPVEQITDNGVSLKLKIAEMTPFDETIFIDADTIWIQGASPQKMFDAIPADCFFSAITEGKHDFETGVSDVHKKYTFWATIEDIAEKYNAPTGTVYTIYQWRSEVMFIRKCDAAIGFFTLAQEIYNDPRVNYLQFAKGVPDELAINIAAMLTDTHPHVYRWTPSYWPNLHGSRVPMPKDLIENGFYLISCGGSYATYSLQKQYGRIMRHSMQRLNRQHVFGLLPKAEFLKDRKL